MTSPRRQQIVADVDSSRDVLRRLGGCLVAFVAFISLFTLTEYLRPRIPTFGLQVVAVALGAFLIHLYGAVARRRWRVALPDAVGILKRDLTSIYEREAADYRLAFRPGAPLGDRALHELLYTLKIVGHFLVFAGLGSLLVTVMDALGITKDVGMFGP